LVLVVWQRGNNFQGITFFQKAFPGFPFKGLPSGKPLDNGIPIPLTKPKSFQSIKGFLEVIIILSAPKAFGQRLGFFWEEPWVVRVLGILFTELPHFRDLTGIGKSF